jgi:uncharacterized membrane protein
VQTRYPSHPTPHSLLPIPHSPFDLYRLLLLLAIIAYTLIFTKLAFDQHTGMRTHRSDLGQIDQAVWNSSRGRPLENTDAGFIATRMTDHVEPILVLISPIFYVWDDVRALLLLQVVAVAAGAWPLYLMALRKLNQLLSPEEETQIWQIEPLRQLTRPLALAVALAYLLAPQLQSAVLTDFHAAPLAVPLILWAFWAVESRRLWHFAIATLLVAAVKEEMALLAAGLGVWALWRWEIGRLRDLQRFSNLPRALTTLLIVISLLWFYLATFVIVPAHAVEVYGVAESGYFARYGTLGDSPVDILKSFFTRPGLVWQIATEPARVDYLVGLLMPFGFLSLLAPEIILLSLPVLLANLLSAYPAQYYGDFHYSAPLVPYFAVSAAYGLARLWRWGARRVAGTAYSYQHLPAAGAGTMALVSLLRNSRTTVRPLLTLLLGLWVVGWALTSYGAAGRGPQGGRYDPTPITDHHRLLPHFAAQIPADAAVTATAAVHPHVSHRRFVYQFPLGLDSPVPAEWALLDVTTNSDMAPGDLKTQVDAMLAGDWGVVDGADGFLLLRKGVDEKTIPERFYDFARLPSNDESHTTTGQASAEWSINLHEDWPRWRQTKLQPLLLQGGETVDPEHDFPTFGVITPGSDTVATLAEMMSPALVWQPLSTLAPGEMLRMTSLPLYLPRTWALVMSTPPQSPDEAGRLRSSDGLLTLVHVYHRTRRDQLQRLPMEWLRNDDLGGLAVAVADSPLTATSATFQLENGAPIAVQSWLPQRVPAGKSLDLWLQWQADGEWPGAWTPFVHLRRNGENQSQADGPPRFFLLYDVADWLAVYATAPDWRQLAVPVAAPVGERWQAVIGLYDPQNGQRAMLVNAAGEAVGDELVVGDVAILPPPVPDQACALIPATCASQPVK